MELPIDNIIEELRKQDLTLTEKQLSQVSAVQILVQFHTYRVPISSSRRLIVNNWNLWYKLSYSDILQILTTDEISAYQRALLCQLIYQYFGIDTVHIVRNNEECTPKLRDFVCKDYETSRSNFVFNQMYWPDNLPPDELNKMHKHFESQNAPKAPYLNPEDYIKVMNQDEFKSYMTNYRDKQERDRKEYFGHKDRDHQ